MRKPKDNHASFLVYASDDTQSTGEHVIIEATDWKLIICRNIWDDNLIPFGDSDLEHLTCLDKENTEKVRNKFRAQTHEELVQSFGKLFVRYGNKAYEEIQKWLSRKGIAYSESMY